MPPTIVLQVIGLVRRSGLERGAHVREQWIADSLGVSRSPVRKALAHLAELGLVSREPNRGYFLNRASTELAHIDVTADADPEEDAYFRIGEDHLAGRLEPEFTTTGICRAYGLAQGQAERVLSRMEREDLIGRKPGRGWEFQDVLSTTDAHDQSYRFRMLIEPNALLEPGFKVNAEAFALHRRQQEALLHGDALLLPRAELFRVNSEFHEMVAGCSANAFLHDAVRRVNRVRRLIEYRHQTDRKRLVRQAREHLSLLDLLEAGKQEEAALFMRDHLDSVRALKTGLMPPAGDVSRAEDG